MPASALYAARARCQRGSVIDASTSLLERQQHDVVRLAMGSPAAEAVPTEAFADLLGRRGAQGAAAYDYSASEGDPGLRTEILRFLEDHGTPCDAGELLVTTGGMQGLDLVFKLFLEPGDLVAVEAPTYTNGTAAIAGYQARMVEVPTDGDGMSVDALAELGAREAPKLIYTVPTFQNPSGTTMALERRQRLVELAARWNALIVEDDPYGFLRFEGEPLPTLRRLGAGHADVIAVQSFSKILAPGLRVGWLIAEPPVVELMVKARQGMDTCTNTLSQHLIAAFLREGLAEGHLGRIRPEYRRRKAALQRSLAEELDGLDVAWTDPEGGFFLWLELPDVIDTWSLFEPALREGVAYIPGQAFSISGGFRHAARIAFSAEPPERAREGVRRLRRAIHAHLRAL